MGQSLYNSCRLLCDFWDLMSAGSSGTKKKLVKTLRLCSEYLGSNPATPHRSVTLNSNLKSLCFIRFLFLFVFCYYLLFFKIFYKEYTQTISQCEKINLDVLEGSDGKKHHPPCPVTWDPPLNPHGRRRQPTPTYRLSSVLTHMQYTQT